MTIVLLYYNSITILKLHYYITIVIPDRNRIALLQQYCYNIIVLLVLLHTQHFQIEFFVVSLVEQLGNKKHVLFVFSFECHQDFSSPGKLIMLVDQLGRLIYNVRYNKDDQRHLTKKFVHVLYQAQDWHHLKTAEAELMELHIKMSYRSIMMKLFLIKLSAGSIIRSWACMETWPAQGRGNSFRP